MSGKEPRREPEKKPRRQTRVPTGRLERLARMGWMAGEFAAGGLADGARRLIGNAPVDPVSAFLSAPRAERLARRLSQMRGAAMKLGQLLSLEGEDTLPPEFAEALAVLRSTADAMPASQVRRALGRAYGKGWEDRFREFDFEPIAAASIGQVHAVIAADGRDLALKIQYPGVARSIDSDIDNLAGLLRMLQVLPVELDLSEIIGEAKRQLRREADYQREAENQRRYAQLVAHDPEILVPAVHDDLSTARVLAMDRVRGLPLEDLRGAEHAQALRDSVGLRLQQLLYREIFEFGFMQTDPNFANYMFDAQTGRLVLLDFGSASEFEPNFVAQYARICRAMLAEDRDAARRAAVEIGYLSGEEPADRSAAFVDLLLLVGEPLRCEGVYDFGSSNLASRARDAGFDLAFRQGFLRVPPPATIFLHRKIAGTFLLCARILARVDARALLLEALERYERSGAASTRPSP